MSSLETTSPFKQTFHKRHSLIVAVHARRLNEALINVHRAIDNWADWVFLVGCERNNFLEFDSIVREIWKSSPGLWIWVKAPFQDVKWNLRMASWSSLDGVWVDNPEIKEVTWLQNNAEENGAYKRMLWYKGLYFGGVAVEGQHHPKDLDVALEVSQKYLDVVVTSGPWITEPAAPARVAKMKEWLWNFPLALAWISTANAEHYPEVDVFIAAASISKDFHNLDPKKVWELVRVLEDMNK